MLVYKVRVKNLRVVIAKTHDNVDLQQEDVVLGTRASVNEDENVGPLNLNHDYICIADDSCGQPAFICQCKLVFKTSTVALRHYYRRNEVPSCLARKNDFYLALLHLHNTRGTVDKSLLKFLAEEVGAPELEIYNAIYGDFFDSISNGIQPIADAAKQAEEVCARALKRRQDHENSIQQQTESDGDSSDENGNEDEQIITREKGKRGLHVVIDAIFHKYGLTWARGISAAILRVIGPQYTNFDRRKTLALRRFQSGEGNPYFSKFSDQVMEKATLIYETAVKSLYDGDPELLEEALKPAIYKSNVYPVLTKVLLSWLPIQPPLQVLRKISQTLVISIDALQSFQTELFEKQKDQLAGSGTFSLEQELCLERLWKTCSRDWWTTHFSIDKKGVNLVTTLHIFQQFHNHENLTKDLFENIQSNLPAFKEENLKLFRQLMAEKQVPLPAMDDSEKKVFNLTVKQVRKFIVLRDVETWNNEVGNKINGPLSNTQLAALVDLNKTCDSINTAVVACAFRANLKEVERELLALRKGTSKPSDLSTDKELISVLTLTYKNLMKDCN